MFGIDVDAWSMELWTMVLGIVTGIPSAILGCFLVLRRMSLLGDAISHAVLPGIVVAFMLSGQLGGIWIFAGALVFGLLTGALTQAVHQLGRVPEDASMGVVFTSLFAVGAVLMSLFVPRVHLDVECVLYGQIEFLPIDTLRIAGWEIPRSLGTLTASLTITVAAVWLCWKELVLGTFDPQLATASGFSSKLIHYGLLLLVAGNCVTAFESVGSILVATFLIVPAATAQLLAERMKTMVLLATLFVVTAAITGTVIANVWDTSVSGMMAVMTGVQFALAVFLAPKQGLVARWISRLSLTIRIGCEDVLGALYRQEEAAARGDSNTPALAAAAALSEVRPWLKRLVLFWLRIKQHIVLQPGGLVLADTGRNWARGVVRSHRLWEAFLQENFELPADHIHDAATIVEHYLGPDTQQALHQDLRHREQDPHGREIPSG